MTDHYDTLGVPRDADAQAIKKAYRKASSAAHPDKGGSDEAQQAVNRDSMVPVAFPYWPTTEYVDVPATDEEPSNG